MYKVINRLIIIYDKSDRMYREVRTENVVVTHYNMLLLMFLRTCVYTLIQIMNGLVEIYKIHYVL